MYTKESHANSEKFHILDPDDCPICTVQNEDEADALLSHLNRG